MAKKIGIVLVAAGIVAAIVLVGLRGGLGFLSVRSDAPSAAKPTSGGFVGSAPVPSKGNVSQALKNKIDQLRHAVKKDPKNSAAVLELARVLQDSHNTYEAAEQYAQGLKLDPKNIAARIDYSLCLYELGRKDEALEQCKRVLAADPINAEALFNLGAIYGNSGVRDSAGMYWSILISRHPNSPLASTARENMKKLAADSTSF